MATGEQEGKAWLRIMRKILDQKVEIIFFFRPWVRERVQIPKGRAYIKILYQVYDLLTKNKSVDLSTCRHISNLLIIPAGTKNQQINRRAVDRFHFPGHSNTLAARGLEELFFQLCCCVSFWFWREIGFGFIY
jgi:hypothetical protein